MILQKRFINIKRIKVMKICIPIVALIMNLILSMVLVDESDKLKTEYENQKISFNSFEDIGVGVLNKNIVDMIEVEKLLTLIEGINYKSYVIDGSVATIEFEGDALEDLKSIEDILRSNDLKYSIASGEGSLYWGNIRLEIYS